MKHIIFVGAVVLVGAAGWQIGGHLSADALGMAIGVLFGIMAGIPAALMVVLKDRNRPEPPTKPFVSAYQPPALPEPTAWCVVTSKRPQIDATVTARRIEAKL